MGVHLVRQIWVVFGVLLNMVGQGMMLSYSSCLLPALQEPESSIKADISTASWLASSVGPSGMLGFLMSSYLMDLSGRKISFAVAILPGACGWLLIYFAHDISTLMIGRVLSGISGGGTVTLGALIIGEYTSPENRGMFLNLKSAAVCVGNMVVHILSNYYHWRNIALFALGPAALTIVFILSSWPESPSWLASKGRFEESEDSFRWLRGNNERSEQELMDLIKSQKEQISYLSKSTFAANLKIFFTNFCKKNFIKPFFIMVFAGIISEFCGRHIFPAYASQIIGNITGDKSQSFYTTLSIDLIIACSITFSSFLVRIIKIRVLLFITGIASLIVLAIVCVYLFLASNNIVSGENTWLPISLLVVYFILANLCCNPIPYILMGEIFPLRYKGTGSAVSGIFISLFLMIGLKITPYLLISIGVHGAFMVYGIIVALSLVVMYFILPETKNRTLQEIENYFNFGRFVDDDQKNSEVSKKMIE